MSNKFNWKYVNLPCPHCGFTHAFKRESWREEPYLAVYASDDSNSRKSCTQELFFGEGTYAQFTSMTTG